MGKSLDWIREEKNTGRLLFRRTYPEALRPHIGKRELKIPLGAHQRMTVSAWRTYENAQRQFEEDVRRARAALTVARKADADSFDPITPELITYLVDAHNADDLANDEEARWLPRPIEQKIAAHASNREAILEDLKEARNLRALGDLEAIKRLWGSFALERAAGLGLRVSPNDPAMNSLLKTFHDGLIATWEALLARLDGVDVPTPAEPPALHRPAKAQPAPISGDGSFQAIVEGLFTATRNPMTETTKEGVRTALRFFRETHGTPTPAEITRAMVHDWLDLVAQRPARVPLADRRVPLPELVEKYHDRPEVARLSAKTVAQHLSALAARWPQARKAGRIPVELSNPFEDHDLERAPDREEPLGFSEAEAKAMFSLPIFTRGVRPLGGKGEASYWLPLILLHTGARPEEIAQLLVDDVQEDPLTGRWMLRITDKGIHPHKGQQVLKTGKKQIGRRTFPVPQALLDLGLPEYVAYLRKSKAVALFPELRTKGKRGMLYAGLGDWLRDYFKANGAVLKGEGRQPVRETRHTWSTQARRDKLPREAMAYIQGHAVQDATAGEGYGDRSPLGEEITKVRFPWFDGLGVQKWQTPKN